MALHSLGSFCLGEEEAYLYSYTLKLSASTPGQLVVQTLKLVVASVDICCIHASCCSNRPIARQSAPLLWNAMLSAEMKHGVGAAPGGEHKEPHQQVSRGGGTPTVAASSSLTGRAFKDRYRPTFLCGCLLGAAQASLSSLASAEDNVDQVVAAGAIQAVVPLLTFFRLREGEAVQSRCGLSPWVLLCRGRGSAGLRTDSNCEYLQWRGG